jgi:hypothetical protein
MMLIAPFSTVDNLLLLLPTPASMALLIILSPNDDVI